MFGGNATYIHLAAHAHPAALAVAALLALAWSVALVIVDLRQQRLPNALTLPAGAVTVALCFFFPTGWWGLLWPGLYVLTAIAVPVGTAESSAAPNVGSGIGGGDIKLALPLGVAVALAGGFAGVLGVMLLSSMITALALLLIRKPGMAHGPSMIVAAWIVAITCALT